MSSTDGRYAKLRTRLSARSTATDLDELDQAFELARHHHDAHVRYSGDPYLTHCLAVAEIVAQRPVPPAWVAAALTHDLHLTAHGPADLLRLPRQVQDIVQLAHELSSGDHSTQEVAALHNSELGRAAITIRVADRLHNARTWHFVTHQKARLRATDTINRIAPEAARLGLKSASHELRRLSYSVLTRDLVCPDRGSGTRRLLGVATRLTPPAERHRYTYEWLTDLAHQESDHDRLRLTAGFVLSALIMRASGTDPA